VLRNPRLSRWKNLPTTEGLLFFAQRLEELLFDYTIDSFKAPALNTLTRCTELLRSAEDVRAGLIRTKTLHPIVEELADSIASDTAAKVVTQPHAADFARFEWWNLVNISQLATQAEALRGYLWKRSYERELIRQLRAAVIEGHRKELISQLAASLSVEWVRQGFSRDFIFLKTRVYFFGVGETPIYNAATAFDEFISFFGPQDYSFDVCIRVHKSVAGLGQTIPGEIAVFSDAAPPPRAGKAKELQFLSAEHNGAYVTLREIKARDARSARNHAFRVLNNISMIAAFHVHRTPFLIDRSALVWQENHPVVLRAPTLPIHKHNECSIQELPARFLKTINALTPSRIGSDAWGRINAALGLHASALGSDDVAVQLTTLWAAIEAIVPSPLDEARIQTITDSIAPILSIGYAHKLFNGLHESLLRCVRSEYLSVVADVGYEHPSAHACAAIVTIASNEALRDRLYLASERNPLLRFRIFAMKKMFDSADAMLTALKDHNRRILWHLRRIYRTRNMIVHAGRTVQSRETLVENVHEYLHQVIIALEGEYAGSPYPSTLDAAFLSLKMRHERHLALLKQLGDTQCDSRNYHSILFGSDLPN